MFCRCVASSRPLTASLNAEPPAAKAAGGFRIGKNGAAGPAGGIYLISRRQKLSRAIHRKQTV